MEKGPSMITVITGALMFCAVILTYMSGSELKAFVPKSARDVSRIERESSGNRELQALDEDLKMAWFIGFPEAGSTYVMNMVQTVSGTSTAANYGSYFVGDGGNVVPVVGDSLPVYADIPGPSFTSTLPSPPSFVLTRANGYGTCYECPPWKYLGPTASLRHMNINKFGSRIISGQEETFEYDPALVQKMLILVRDPMDNVAARFFVKRAREIDDQNTHFTEKYEGSRSGFYQYCQDMNHGPYRDQEVNWYTQNGFFEQAKFVPCASEFVKIFSFYNFVRLMGIENGLQMKTVPLKDFAVQVDSTIDDVFDFLLLERVNDPPPNFLGNGEGLFSHFYSDAERQAIAKLGQAMVLGPAVWEGFKPYLDKYLNN